MDASSTSSSAHDAKPHDGLEPPPLKLAVLLSGGGTTMVNLATRIHEGRLNAQIVLVLASNTHAGGIEKARNLHLPTVVVPRKAHDSPAAFAEVVFGHINQAQADLVCLAGFLSLLPIPAAFENRVLNIHPSLLPKFGGKGMHGHHVHEAVIAAGESESGCTVHYADNTYDTGPVLLQRHCAVLPDDTADALAARVFEQECEAYPAAIEQAGRALRGKA